MVAVRKEIICAAELRMEIASSDEVVLVVCAPFCAFRGIDDSEAIVLTDIV